MNTYHLTWTCFGTWRHGDPRGSVDRDHNTVGDAWLEPDAEHLAEAREKMTQPPKELDGPRRIITRDAMIVSCQRKGWPLHAVHVRSNHVHGVLAADRDPKQHGIAFRQCGQLSVE